MILKLKRTPGIYLVGFMGCGKSTVGRLLADHIGWRFADLDDDIEAAEKTTIAELFAHKGEEEFRRIERERVRERVRKIQSGHPIVIALGGGAFTQDETVELLQNNGISIWIDTALAVIKKRVSYSNHRPLARDPEKLEQLYWARREFYSRADYHIEVPEDNSHYALAEVLKLPAFE
jgi:shikimate kinase